jgi:5'-nucleotidase
MRNTRRVFVTQLAMLSAASAIGKPLSGTGQTVKILNSLQPGGRTVTVRHTNDLHGQTSPFIDGKGGIEQVSAIWQRDLQKGLLVDAGGFTGGLEHQGKQAQFIQLMNNMGYLAAGLSPREMAFGADYLAGLAAAMRFNLVNCNHQFNGPLAARIKPYVTVHDNGIKIGITGVCARLKDFKNTDALQSANKTAAFLKTVERCDMVICLSYLGHENEGLAARSENIDMIIGGGPGKLQQNAWILKNAGGDDVVLAITGSKGVMTGCTAFTFNGAGNKTGVQPDYFIPGNKIGEPSAISFEKLNQQKNRLILV